MQARPFFFGSEGKTYCHKNHSFPKPTLQVQVFKFNLELFKARLDEALSNLV